MTSIGASGPIGVQDNTTVTGTAASENFAAPASNPIVENSTVNAGAGTDSFSAPGTYETALNSVENVNVGSFDKSTSNGATNFNANTVTNSVINPSAHESNVNIGSMNNSAITSPEHSQGVDKVNIGSAVQSSISTAGGNDQVNIGRATNTGVDLGAGNDNLSGNFNPSTYQTQADPKRGNVLDGGAGYDTLKGSGDSNTIKNFENVNFQGDRNLITGTNHLGLQHGSEHNLATGNGHGSSASLSGADNNTLRNFGYASVEDGSNANLLQNVDNVNFDKSSTGNRVEAGGIFSANTLDNQQLKFTSGQGLAYLNDGTKGLFGSGDEIKSAFGGANRFYVDQTGVITGYDSSKTIAKQDWATQNDGRIGNIATKGGDYAQSMALLRQLYGDNVDIRGYNNAANSRIA